MCIPNASFCLSILGYDSRSPVRSNGSSLNAAQGLGVELAEGDPGWPLCPAKSKRSTVRFRGRTLGLRSRAPPAELGSILKENQSHWPLSNVKKKQNKPRGTELMIQRAVQDILQRLGKPRLCFMPVAFEAFTDELMEKLSLVCLHVSRATITAPVVEPALHLRGEQNQALCQGFVDQ
ncbi:hypothetical protein M513_11081 [Trichuris suis]|uniref:Histone H2A/H2B/H3 domain-containing protein n=1 Tax=Trichuris suis TaxID=68888 RepID=A0A085LSW5_9BILA|nr:hypothetical protein M513_11081 [Trichuris suis]